MPEFSCFPWMWDRNGHSYGAVMWWWWWWLLWKNIPPRSAKRNLSLLVTVVMDVTVWKRSWFGFPCLTSWTLSQRTLFCVHFGASKVACRSHPAGIGVVALVDAPLPLKMTKRPRRWQAPLFNFMNSVWIKAQRKGKFKKKVVFAGDAMMLEADIILKGQGTKDQKMVPIVASPPAVTSDLTFEEWVNIVKNGQKGFELHFHSIEAVELTLQTLQELAQVSSHSTPMQSVVNKWRGSHHLLASREMNQGEKVAFMWWKGGKSEGTFPQMQAVSMVLLHQPSLLCRSKFPFGCRQIFSEGPMQSRTLWILRGSWGWHPPTCLKARCP